MHVRSALIGALGVALLVTGPAAAHAAMSTPTASAQATSSSAIRLSWIDGNVNVGSFYLERSLKPTSGFKRIAIVSGSVRSYQDGGLLAATTYHYRLRAKAGSTYSRRSSVASATTLVAAAPTVPPTTTPAATRTATPGPATTALPTASATVVATRTATAVPTATRTATAVPTATRTATAAPTATRTPTAVPTATRTATPVVTATRTATQTPVPTQTPARTATATSTATRTATPAPTATPSVAAEPWALRAGGAGSDATKAVAIDGRGDVVVTGSFNGTTDFGGGVLSAAGGTDVILAKYSKSGAHVWSKRIGSIGLDRAFGVAVDRSANCDGQNGTDCIVIAGSFAYTVDFDPGAGTTSLSSAGAGDVFVAKYTSAGALLWAKRFGGGSYDDYAYGVAVDPSAGCDGGSATGCVVVIGNFYNALDVDGAALSGPAGVLTPFVVKLGPGGARVWAKTFANTNEAVGRAVAVSAAGEIAVTGSFKGSMNFGNGTKGSWGNDDVFVAKLRGADGAGVWSSRFGSDGLDSGYGVAFDAAGDVTITGTFSRMSGSVGFGGDAWLANGTDIFVAQLGGAGGAHLWSRRCTGTYTNTRHGGTVATDALGNVVVTGNFYGSLSCGTDTPTLTGLGSSDILVAKFDAAGRALWMQRFGNVGGVNTGTGVATDDADDAVVVSSSFQGQIDVGGQAMTSAGMDDLLLLRMRP